MVADPSVITGDDLARRVTATGRYEVTWFDDPAVAPAVAREAVADPPLAVVTHLRFPDRAGDGLDVLRAFARWCPESALVVRPGDNCDLPLVRRAWRAHQPLSVLAADAPWADVVELLDGLGRTGRARVDPAWRDRLAAPG